MNLYSLLENFPAGDPTANQLQRPALSRIAEKPMKLNVLLSIALLTVMSSTLMAGVVYEIEVTDQNSSSKTPASSEIAVQGDMMKMVMDSYEAGKPSGDLIWRSDRREMIVIDHEDKSYMVMDEETVSSMTDQMSRASAQMAEALKNVPEEQRAMVEQMMKKRMPQAMAEPPVTEIESTGETKEINGYPCVKYIATVNGKAERNLWVTDWENIEGGDEASAVFLEMSGFFEDMMRGINQAMGGLGGGLGSENMGTNAFDQLSKLNGFPVVTEELANDGSIESRSELSSARREDLAPDVFEAPAGYKRRSMGPN
jgi:hypothetical protein